jgi:hypothetical protein
MKSTKVSMRNRSLGVCLLMSGCSLALSPDKKQCVADDECGQHNGKPIYQCVENYCEQVSCNDDSTCRSRGDFICESNVCENAECSRDQDCKDQEMCAAGRCTDPRDAEDEALFGCFDVKQPLTSSQPGSLRLQLFSYGESAPVKDLKVVVCKAADLSCNTPVAATHTYENGTLTINGLENGNRYNIRFTGKDGSGSEFLEHEYYMQRPIVGATVEADKLEMVPRLLVDVVADSAGLLFDPAKGLVLTQTFGCDLKPLAGVSVTDSLMAVPFYLAAGLPNADATETDSAGVAGFVNMEARTSGAALQHKLTFNYAGDPMFSYTVAPRPNVVTFVQVYLGDFNTTIDRAETRPTRRK